jgi:hypothetical protein
MRVALDELPSNCLYIPQLEHNRRSPHVASDISKNARREAAQELVSRWGGKIVMKTVFEKGKLRHFAVCEKTGNKARKPRDLM